jgi:hypothetical protein
MFRLIYKHRQAEFKKNKEKKKRKEKWKKFTQMQGFEISNLKRNVT